MPDNIHYDMHFSMVAFSAILLLFGAIKTESRTVPVNSVIVLTNILHRGFEFAIDYWVIIGLIPYYFFVSLIVMFSCSFLAWLYAFDFLYPPISYSPWVLLVNTTTELTGTILLSVLLRQKLIMRQKEEPLKNAY